MALRTAFSLRWITIMVWVDLCERPPSKHTHVATPATEADVQNWNVGFLEKWEGCLFLNQYFYSLLFGYRQAVYMWRLPDIWVNISKSAHDLYKGQNMSLLCSAASFTNITWAVRWGHFLEAKQPALTEGHLLEAISLPGGRFYSHSPAALTSPWLRTWTRTGLSFSSHEFGFHGGFSIP